MITVADVTIFDRMEWYASKSVVFEQARKRFSILMLWLSKHAMLNAEGTEATKHAIPDDFSLSDRMLTQKGIAFMEAHYDRWLMSGAISDPISTRSLESAIG